MLHQKSEKSIYINGQWYEGQNTIKNINPSNIKQNIGDFAQASSDQVELAIDAANAAQPVWEKTSLEHKQRVLQAIGDELISRCNEIGKVIALEEGKTLAEGIGETYRSGQFFQYFAAEVLRQIGDYADSVRNDVTIEVTREAVGTVAIISPWNFPIATAAWKIAPALAFGNSIVWKPANLTPASAVILTEIIHKQDLPAGTFNLILGSGSNVGNQLINSKRIQAVSFTGSSDIGKKVAEATSKNFAKCQLEMGSKNALYIADDANISTAIEATISGSYSGTGQKCTASSRLIVSNKIYDQYVEALIQKIKTLKVRHSLDKDAFMGPVASDSQLQSNLKWVKRAESLGAELLIGGEQLHLEHEGYYMAPTLFTNTNNKWDINQEEIFAPMACIIRADDFEHGLELVNQTRFGLTSGIITQSLKNSSLFKRHAQTGCVMVNLPTAGTDYHVPFGGRKESSFGSREQGQYAKEFYTIVKTTYQRPY
ncbi:aldehyde dehydrogenase family protein [Francisella halioticida]|uniref:Aldehyde dehydrogenase family protein n=1 Tax=Francisella halioticida TaxID=549298 RepID=A0ABM6LXL3_9GAMM|nr:aldehyde dehydrogenase family protein [Francisella halioticida]ASG67263.1 aldehyde dehydrogenase family protein [Francisella halioticida]